jgi:hypothetical protein
VRWDDHCTVTCCAPRICVRASGSPCAER